MAARPFDSTTAAGWSPVSIMPAKPYCPATNDGSVPRAAISSRSVPAENARPAPVMTTTATA